MKGLLVLAAVGGVVEPIGGSYQHGVQTEKYEGPASKAPVGAK